MSCAILARSSATWTLPAYGSAKVALLRGDSVLCSVRTVACPLQLSGSAVSTSLLLRWLYVVSEDEKKKDVFSFSFPPSLFILILTQVRRLFVSPRPHGLIVVLILEQAP